MSWFVLWRVSCSTQLPWCREVTLVCAEHVVVFLSARIVQNRHAWSCLVSLKSSCMRLGAYVSNLCVILYHFGQLLSWAWLNLSALTSWSLSLVHATLHIANKLRTCFISISQRCSSCWWCGYPCLPSPWLQSWGLPEPHNMNLLFASLASVFLHGVLPLRVYDWACVRVTVMVCSSVCSSQIFGLSWFEC